MKRLRANIEKFSFGQLTSNSDGKTSGSGTAGLYIVFVGGICFLLGCLNMMFSSDGPDILVQSILFCGIGATLLGYRKSKDSSIPPLDDLIETKKSAINDQITDSVTSSEDSSVDSDKKDIDNYDQINS